MSQDATSPRKRVNSKRGISQESSAFQRDWRSEWTPSGARGRRWRCDCGAAVLAFGSTPVGPILCNTLPHLRVVSRWDAYLW